MNPRTSVGPADGGVGDLSDAPVRRSEGPVELWKGAFAALGPDRLRMLLTGGLALVVGTLETVLLYLISRLATNLGTDSSDLVVGGSGPVPEVTMSVLAVVGVSLALVVVLISLSIPIAGSVASISARSLVRTRSRLIRAQMNAEWRYRTERGEGHFAQLVGEYCQRTEQLVAQLGVVFVYSCQVVMLLVGAVVIAPLATAVAAVALALLTTAVRPFSKGVKAGSLKNANRNRQVVSETQQFDRLGAEVTAFEVGGAVADSLEKQIRKASRNLRTVRFRTRLTPVLYQYGALGVLLIMIGVVTIVADGQVQGLAALVLILIRVLTYVRGLLTSSQAAREFEPYWERIDLETADLEAHATPTGSTPVDVFASLEFDGVSFAYRRDRQVLSDVSFQIERGDCVGLVGPSGGGKTTTMQLMLRLLDPDDGFVRFNGLPLGDLDRRDWSRLVAFVPQDNKLISGTVADNIAFFRGGVSREAVVAAARSAHIHDEIAALPEGYDTAVGPGSQALSGGQCQRVGIARALLGRPELLVLDEPTSALDSRSESLIRQTLSELMGTTTMIIIAHRPATLEICNRIFRVESTRVAETPTEPSVLG